jgi:methionyl aminopeptidase
MRRAGRLAAKLLDHLADMVKPGVSTLEINDEAERWTQRPWSQKCAPRIPWLS